MLLNTELFPTVPFAGRVAVPAPPAPIVTV
jgi:hypothetical protein